MPIIESLLDSDLYKFTMGQAVFHQFPDAQVKYAFKCRTKDIDLTRYIPEIRKEIESLCELKFTSDELDYLRSLRFMKHDYIYFLSLLKLNKNFIDVSKNGNEIEIIVSGPWFLTVFFEVPILAIVNEVYFRSKNIEDTIPQTAYDRLIVKHDLIRDTNVKFADFGTRRRFSRKWQDLLLKMSKVMVADNLIGTSNVYFAMKHKLTPIGTMAHEWIQAGQAFVRLKDSQKFMLQKWADEYRGDLGIALSDTLGFDAFLNDFDLYFAKLFDGCRQDSGDPYEWTEKLLKHYEKMKIDPKTKRTVYSDGLDFQKAIDLYNKYGDKTQITFGIGTNLTNDTGLEPIQIVMKMTECNGHPVAKISDSPGKEMCRSEEYVRYLKSVFEIVK